MTHICVRYSSQLLRGIASRIQCKKLAYVYIPINRPLCASTRPVLVRCCQRRTSTGPVLATNGMFTGYVHMCVNKGVERRVHWTHYDISHRTVSNLKTKHSYEAIRDQKIHGSGVMMIHVLDKWLLK